MSAVVPLEVRVEQARRAAAAGHFRMAELYAGRALQLVAEDRAQCRKDLGLVNRKLRAQRMGKSFGGFLDGLVENVSETFRRLAVAFSPVNTQKDHILTSQVEHPNQRSWDALIAAHPSLLRDPYRDQRLIDVMYAMQAGEVLTEEQRRFL